MINKNHHKFDYKYEISYHDVADGVRVNVTVRDDNPNVAIKSINSIYKQIRKTNRIRFTKMVVNWLIEIIVIIFVVSMFGISMKHVHKKDTYGHNKNRGKKYTSEGKLR